MGYEYCLQVFDVKFVEFIEVKFITPGAAPPAQNQAPAF